MTDKCNCLEIFSSWKSLHNFRLISDSKKCYNLRLVSYHRLKGGNDYHSVRLYHKYNEHELEFDYENRNQLDENNFFCVECNKLLFTIEQMKDILYLAQKVSKESFYSYLLNLGFEFIEWT